MVGGEPEVTLHFLLPDVGVGVEPAVGARDGPADTAGCVRGRLCAQDEVGTVVPHVQQGLTECWSGIVSEELRGHRVEKALHGFELGTVRRILEHRPRRHLQGEHLLERMAARSGRRRGVMALAPGIEVPGMPFPSGPFHRLRPRVDQPTVDEHLVSQSPGHIRLVAIGVVTEVVLHVRLEPFPGVAVVDVAEVVHALPPVMMSDLARPPHPHGIPAGDASDITVTRDAGVADASSTGAACGRPTRDDANRSRWPVGRPGGLSAVPVGERRPRGGEFAVAGVTPFVRGISCPREAFASPTVVRCPPGREVGVGDR
jgi:hypothetical protein